MQELSESDFSAFCFLLSAFRLLNGPPAGNVPLTARQRNHRGADPVIAEPFV